MLIYYRATTLANIIALFAFFEKINITVLSVIPLVLIALTIFQSLIFKHEKQDKGFKTNYGSNLSEGEEHSLLNYTSAFMLATIPWMIPFIIFFFSPVKILSVLVYVIGFVGGAILFRFKNKGKITSRMDIEEEERRDQEKKEELGKWK